MNRERRLKNVFEMRKELCFVDGPIGDEETKNTYDHRLSYLRMEVDAFYYQFLGLDLTVSSPLYASCPSYEEIVATPDDTLFSKIVHHKPKLEDFDYNLPDDQNLWKVMSDSNATNNRQMRISYLRGLPTKVIEDTLSGETIDEIVEFLPGREEFEWYSDIVLNLEFKEKVQIITDENNHSDVRDKLDWLFGVFGYNFTHKFVYGGDFDYLYENNNKETAMMFVSDEELPIKQITIASVEDEDRVVATAMECSYEALCQFLIEDRIERGINEEL